MAEMFDGLPETEASALTGFAGNRIERRSEGRQPDAVERALADPTARLYLFAGDRPLMRAADPLFDAGEADKLGVACNEAVLLGWTPEGPRLAATVAAGAETGDAVTAADLRALATGGAVGRAHLGALAQARSLTHWHQRHRFCANCGSATTIANGGTRRDCPRCGAEHFPRTDPVVIMLAIRDDHCLLGRQPRFRPGMYSCLAGYVEPGETIEDAVRRETLEEAGITIRRVRYHASQPWPFPASLMIGCYGEAVTSDIHRDPAEIEDCRWFSRAEARAILAGDHGAGITAPPEMAIAYHLIRAWAEG
jgi:NAD+ diphosphatase